MLEETATKTCKMCRKEIAVEARKCPYCQHWQNRLSTVVYHPLFFLLFFLLFFVCPMFILQGFVAASYQRTFGTGESFQNYAGQITIADTKLEFGEDQCGPVVVVIGKMRNHSPVEWKDVRFQVDLFNRKGELFDAAQQEAYSWRLPVREETSFKVSFRRQFPENEYADHKVRVISAADGRQRF